MSYAVCRMQKVKSAGLKGMQFHNQRERESRTNEDIDRERTHENYDLQNDENIKIGRASCREREKITEVRGTEKKKRKEIRYKICASMNSRQKMYRRKRKMT